jgi:hypothetical protein
MIDTLRLLAPIKTFYLKSNHDQMTAYYAVKYLEAWYRKCKDVEIDTDAFPRKYVEYGKNLIMQTHGENSNKQLFSLMPAEAAAAWGRTKFREVHAAHLHTEGALIQEFGGVTIFRMSAMTAADTWTTEEGYIGNIRRAQTFIYDKEYGRVGAIYTPVLDSETS